MEGQNSLLTLLFSLVISCDSQEEIDHFWYGLSAGGEEQACGWLQDKFGFHWQVVPSSLGRLISGGEDPARAQRVMNAMLRMTKMDLAELDRAYGLSK